MTVETEVCIAEGAIEMSVRGRRNGDGDGERRHRIAFFQAGHAED